MKYCPIEWRIRELTITASTNDDALRAAEAGEAEGLVVWARRQTAGRGRYGRAWESPEGNLYCSLLLRPKIEPRTIGQYSFVAALALRDAVQEFLPQAAVTFKWPNDILVNGKKIGGILLEAGEGWLVAGFGLNVAHYPKETLYPVTSLKESGVAEADLQKILDRLLEAFQSWYDVMQKKGFRPVRSAWLQHAQKGPLSVRLPQENIAGTFAGLDDNGNLLLRLENGAERAISTGDVFI